MLNNHLTGQQKIIGSHTLDSVRILNLTNSDRDRQCEVEGKEEIYLMCLQEQDGALH